MTLWAPVILSAATGAMVALPLTPAIMELHRRKDAAPLVTRTDDGKIENFARSMKEYMQPLVALGEDDCGKLLSHVLRDGAAGFIVGMEDIANLPDGPVDAVVYGRQSLIIPTPVCFVREFYVRGNLRLAGESLLRAVLVEGNAELGDRTSVMRWIHVAGDLEAGQESRLLGRVSADGTLMLRNGCQFERMRARTIHFGAQNFRASKRSDSWLDPNISYQRVGRVRSHGDFHLGASDVFQGHIVASGKVTIAEDVLTMGNIKARTRVEIGAGTHVEGTIVSRGRTTIGERCYVKGPVLSEEEIVIGAGTEIGTPDCPTTVSAPRIRMFAGSRVCGAVWAREAGEVVP